MSQTQDWTPIHIADLYDRYRVSGSDHAGAMDFIEAQLPAELRAAVATVKAGLSEDATGQ